MRLAILNIHNKQWKVHVKRNPLWYGTRYDIYVRGNKVSWCFRNELEFVKEKESD
jgi:hypothetical protein